MSEVEEIKFIREKYVELETKVGMIRVLVELYSLSPLDKLREIKNILSDDRGGNLNQVNNSESLDKYGVR